MPELKKQLKEAREKRNLTVQQVAALTNIKTEHIRALEEGNYSFFSAPIYIRGFVRSIAIALKLDLGEVMNQLDIELDQQKVNLKNADLQKPSDPSPTPSPERQEPASAFPWKNLGFIVLGIVVLASGFLVVKNLPKNDKNTPPEIEKASSKSPGLIKRNYQESLQLPATNNVHSPAQ